MICNIVAQAAVIEQLRSMKLKEATKEDAEVTLTVTPHEGYELASLTGTDRFGDPVRVTENRDGTFTMPNGQVSVSATFALAEREEMPFTDVTEANWFYDEVYYVWSEGLMVGSSSTLFNPTGTTTREQLAVIFMRFCEKVAV